MSRDRRNRIRKEQAMREPVTRFSIWIPDFQVSETWLLDLGTHFQDPDRRFQDLDCRFLDLDTQFQGPDLGT